MPRSILVGFMRFRCIPGDYHPGIPAEFACGSEAAAVKHDAGDLLANGARTDESVFATQVTVLGLDPKKFFNRRKKP